jgi:uroporphyrinogen-III synthase
MRVVLTRPETESRTWAGQLQAHGVSCLVLPLIAITPAPNPAAVRAAWDQLPACQAALFVSANAVQGFFATGAAWPTGPRAWAPGPGTREALRAAGVAQERIDAPAPDALQFDSEALWQQVASQVQPGFQVLLVRGGDATGRAAGREWLAEQVAARGGRAASVVAYARGVPHWSAAELAAAHGAATDGSLWLFSSSEAVRNLLALAPGEHWHAARALATHPRIAQAARAAGFGSVYETRPALADVLASIESRR